MTKVQTIRDKKGRPAYAVLPYDEYESLRAAAQQAREVAEAEATLARMRAGIEGAPIEVVKRILAGARPIRAWREHRGLTLTALAAAAGISHAYLSEIETGRRDGSLRILTRVAHALEVAPAELLPPEAAEGE